MQRKSSAARREFRQAFAPMAGHILIPTPMPDARFNACMPLTAREEGGDSNDPHDRGGVTSRGITQTDYDEARDAAGLPRQDVRLASDDELTRRYYNKYWLPNCPKMPPGVDLVYFDWRVNAGEHATVHLQRVLNIKQDSDEFKRGHEHIGPVTLAALAQVQPAEFVNRLSAERLAWYRSLADFQYFGTDWTRRTERIRAAALKMASAKPAPPTKEPPVTTTPAPVQITDPIPQIISFLETAKKFLPMVSGFLPPPLGPMLSAALPIVEELLQLVEDAKSKSGVDLIQIIGQHLETIGQHVQTVATQAAQPVPAAPTPNAGG